MLFIPERCCPHCTQHCQGRLTSGGTGFRGRTAKLQQPAWVRSEHSRHVRPGVVEHGFCRGMFDGRVKYSVISLVISAGQAQAAKPICEFNALTRRGGLQMRRTFHIANDCTAVLCAADTGWY